MRTLVDSLDAENEYRDAQIRTLQARTALFVTRARLLALSSDLEDALAPSP
jgi:outer membrane protein